MPVLICDPVLEGEVRADRDKRFPNNRDEVWEGVLVMPPLPNNEHQVIAGDLGFAFHFVVNRAGGDRILPGCNVSDLDQGWLTNYREPDVAVYLSTTHAKNCGTHWMGGPDLAVEITSPGEDPRQKLAFYSKVGTRELLIVDRDPWEIELYQLREGKLTLLDVSNVAHSAVLFSSVLPLSFQLQPGTLRPTILISHTMSKQTWTA